MNREQDPNLLGAATGTFSDRVAAGTPTPGGGSVAAYCGQLAAALGIMMCNLTTGKPKYAGVEARITAIKQELERLANEFRSLIDEDAASFESVLAAYRHPKDTEQQKEERERLIQDALRRAANTPYHTAERSVETLEQLVDLGTSGNPNALSDVATGAQLARAAARGACYNVLINLSGLTDREAADSIRSGVSDLMSRADRLAEQVEALFISQT
jgi:formiminotetrahydrofolate cyclodeaminase